VAEVFGGNGGFGIKFGVYAALTYDVISATNSSPQTTELNAAQRAETLMKWVRIGLLQAAGFALFGAWVESRTGGTPAAPLLGAGVAAVLLWAQYVHAKNAGQRSSQPGTEVPGGFRVA
jgi:hypothetical protein